MEAGSLGVNHSVKSDTPGLTTKEMKPKSSAAAVVEPEAAITEAGQHTTITTSSDKAAGIGKASTTQNYISKQRILSDSEVKEAVKKLTQAGCKTEASRLLESEKERRQLSPSTTHRLYNWNTNHFYPDVHHLDDSIRSCLVPFPISPIMPKQIDTSDHSSFSNERKDNGGLNLKIDIDLDSGSDFGDEEQSCPKRWQKSPLRVRKIRKRDGRPVSAEINYDPNTNKLYIHSLVGSDVSAVTSSKEQSAGQAKTKMSPRKARHPARRLSAPDKLKELERNDNVSDKQSMESKTRTNRPIVGSKSKTNGGEIDSRSHNLYTTDGRQQIESSNKNRKSEEMQKIEVKPAKIQNKDILQTGEDNGDEVCQVNVKDLIQQFASPSSDKTNASPITNLTTTSVVDPSLHDKRKSEIVQPRKAPGGRLNSSSYENIYDDLLLKTNGSETKSKHKEKSDRPASSGGRFVGFDAKSLMQEEREKFRVYKVEYMRQHSSGDESSKSIKDEKSRRDNINIDIPPDEYVYVLRKLHRTNNEQDKANEYASFAASSVSGTNPFLASVGGSKTDLGVGTQQSAYSARQSSKYEAKELFRSHPTSSGSRSSSVRPDLIPSPTPPPHLQTSYQTEVGVKSSRRNQTETLDARPVKLSTSDKGYDKHYVSVPNAILSTGLVLQAASDKEYDRRSSRARKETNVKQIDLSTGQAQHKPPMPNLPHISPADQWLYNTGYQPSSPQETNNQHDLNFSIAANNEKSGVSLISAPTFEVSRKSKGHGILKSAHTSLASTPSYTFKTTRCPATILTQDDVKLRNKPIKHPPENPNEKHLSDKSKNDKENRSKNTVFLPETVTTATEKVNDYSTIFSLIGYPTNKPSAKSTSLPSSSTTQNTDLQFDTRVWHIPYSFQSDNKHSNNSPADLIQLSQTPSQYHQYAEYGGYVQDGQHQRISSDISFIPNQSGMPEYSTRSYEYYPKDDTYGSDSGAWSSVDKRRPVAAWPEVEFALEQDSLDRKLLRQNRDKYGLNIYGMEPQPSMRDYVYGYVDYPAHDNSKAFDDIHNTAMSSQSGVPQGLCNAEGYYGSSDPTQAYQEMYFQQILNAADFQNANTYGTVDSNQNNFQDQYFSSDVDYNSHQLRIPETARHKEETYETDLRHHREPMYLQSIQPIHKLEPLNQGVQQRPTSLPPPTPPPLPPQGMPPSNLRPVSKPSSRSTLKRSDTAPESTASKSTPRLPTNDEFQRELKSVLANLQLKKRADGDSDENITPESFFIEPAAKPAANLKSLETSKTQSASPSLRPSELQVGQRGKEKSLTGQAISSFRSRSCDRADYKAPQKSSFGDSDEAQQSVADLRKKLFGEGASSVGKADTESSQNYRNEPKSGISAFLKTEDVLTNIPASKASHTDTVKGQVLYDYVSYKDSQKPRRSNIQDELTDFERFYESINEQISDNKAEAEAVTNEPCVKRLSISNVRMLTDLQEKQTSLDYAKQWLQDSERSIPKALSTSSNDNVTFRNILQPFNESKPTESKLSMAASQASTEYNQEKLPRKVFDDMAYRKMQRSGIPTGKYDSDTVASSEGRSSPIIEAPRKSTVRKSVGKFEPERKISKLKFSIVPPTVKLIESSQNRAIAGRSKENQANRSRSLCIVKRPKDDTVLNGSNNQSVRRSNSLSGNIVPRKLTPPDCNENQPVVVSHMIQLFSKSNSTPDLSERTPVRKVYNKQGELVDPSVPETSQTGEDAPYGEEVKVNMAKRQQTPRDVKQRHEARASITVKLSCDSGYVENESDSRSSSGTENRAINTGVSPQYGKLVVLDDDSSSESTSEGEMKSDGIETNSASSVKESDAKPSTNLLKYSTSLPLETPQKRSERLLKLRQAWFEQPVVQPTGISVKLRADFPHGPLQAVSTASADNFVQSEPTESDAKRLVSSCEKKTSVTSLESKSVPAAESTGKIDLSKSKSYVTGIPALSSPDKLSTVLQLKSGKDIPYQFEEKQYEKIWDKDTIISELRQEKFRQDQQRIDAVEEVKRNIQKVDAKCSEHLSDEVHLEKMSGANSNVTQITSKQVYRKTEESLESDKPRDQRISRAPSQNQEHYSAKKISGENYSVKQFPEENHSTKQFPGFKNFISNIFSEISDGEMTDATDVTLDGMVGANRSERPFSPETTDLSDMEQRSSAYLERFRRLPQSTKTTVRDERSFVANEKTSVFVKGGTATLLDQSSTSTQTQRISVRPSAGELESSRISGGASQGMNRESGNGVRTSGQGINLVSGASYSQGIPQKHESEAAQIHVDSSQRAREAQIAQAREEMKKYRKNKPIESDEVKGEQAERRRSIKELVESFEDLSSPFLRGRPRSMEVPIDQLPSTAKQGQ